MFIQLFVEAIPHSSKHKARSFVPVGQLTDLFPSTHHCTNQSVEELQQTQGGEPITGWQVDFAPLRIKREEALKLDPNAYVDDGEEEEDGEGDDDELDGYVGVLAAGMMRLLPSIYSRRPCN